MLKFKKKKNNTYTVLMALIPASQFFHCTVLKQFVARYETASLCFFAVRCMFIYL